VRDGIYTIAIIPSTRHDRSRQPSREEQALWNAGPDTVYYATNLRGASNQKAKGQLAFRPRPLEWLGAQTSAGV